MGGIGAGQAAMGQWLGGPGWALWLAMEPPQVVMCLLGVAALAGLAWGLWQHGARRRQRKVMERVQEFRNALFERSAECVYLMDPSGRFIDANPAALQLLGYSKEELRTLDMASLLDAEQLEMARARLEEVRCYGYTQGPAEFRIRRKDGEYVQVESRASMIYQDGRPWAIQKIARDLTERRRAEQALRESEALFRNLAENMRAAVGVVQGTRLVYANRFMGEMLGYSVAELMEVEFPQLVLPEYRARMIDLARRRQLGEEVPLHYEFPALTKGGECRWIDFSAARTLYRGQPAIVGTGIDITDRRSAEEHLQVYTGGLRLLAETATRLLAAARPAEILPEVVGEVSDYLRLEFYWHYAMEEDGQHLRLQSSRGLDEEARRRLERPRLGETLCATAAQQRRSIVAEAVQESTEEKVQPLRRLGIRAFACYPLIANEQVLGTLSYATKERDHFTEEELELMRATAHQVAMAMDHQRLSAELERHAAELAEANQAKDHFMAILSHELRTPLTPVLAASCMLEQDETIPHELRDDLTMIRRNAEMEARLIDDLLDVTRIVRGKLELEKCPVQLRAVIHQAVDVCREAIEAKQLHFVVDTDATLPFWVEGDAARLQQVFWNLLKNAVKFTPPGGAVSLRCATSDGHVTVEISDTGEGISQEAMDRIFLPFEQAERAITRQFGGLGLGLAISRALIELHHGTIAASSEGKGRGATFRVDLPLLEPAQIPAMPEGGERGVSAGGRKARLLLVEDHVDTAVLLARLLRREGYTVEHAPDLASARQLVEQAQRTGTPFELLLSDLGLPDGSGQDLMRWLRARGDSLPGIALSGFGMVTDIEASHAAGFAEHVTKPVNLRTLQAAISRVLQKARGAAA